MNDYIHYCMDGEIDAKDFDSALKVLGARLGYDEELEDVGDYQIGVASHNGIIQNI